jgi:uncharacterized FAD-dependent dehydrogenase
MQELIEYTDQIYLSFGADSHVEGLNQTEEVKGIRRRAIEAGLQLVDCPIRHLGTEKAHDLYLAIENDLKAKGVEMLFGYECNDIILEKGACTGVIIHKYGDGDEQRLMGKDIVIASGRRGADWLEKICSKYDIAHRPGPVDMGVRVEVRNEVMEELNKVLYEAKLIGYPAPFKDKVRTFCQNPGGFVAQENYDNNLAVVNGHSYKEKKSANTDLAILCSHNFTEPFHEPILYAQKDWRIDEYVGRWAHFGAAFGDVLAGKRTWDKELAFARTFVRP